MNRSGLLLKRVSFSALCKRLWKDNEPGGSPSRQVATYVAMSLCFDRQTLLSRELGFITGLSWLVLIGTTLAYPYC